MITVYILFSKKSNKYYTGQTQNLPNRIREHNSGETKSIRGGIPWELVWHKEFATREEAVQLELKIKGRGASRFLIDTQNL